jgi:hypothetical protein
MAFTVGEGVGVDVGAGVELALVDFVAVGAGGPDLSNLSRMLQLN